MNRTLTALALLLLPGALGAQVAESALLAERLTRMTAVTGFEAAALDSVQALLPGARRDRAGNVIVERGSGPATLIACPFDEVGYVVGGIREDGWLTLRRVGARAPNAIWDQSHEGQRVTVWGERGALPAVIGVRSTHLTRGRALSDTPFTVDDAVVDIGASSAAEVRAAGVELLAPVARAKQVTRYGAGLLAGPNAGRRSACAALATAWLASSPSPRGRVVVAFLVEHELSLRGLRTLVAKEGPFMDAIILDAVNSKVDITQLVMGRAGSDSSLTSRVRGLGTVRAFGPVARHRGTPVETVDMREVEEIRDALILFLGGR
jgi:putative aminopeptidase FrvX